MPTYRGNDIARSALREIGVLDPVEAGGDELLSDTLAVGSDMLDQWRTEPLTIPTVARSVYSLTSGVQTYTIGSGATFNQDYPNAIEQWSVIPARAATNPIELAMGRPYTYDQWQSVRIKSQTGPYPVRMYWDRGYDANGRGNLLFHPIPNVTTVDVLLYQLIPALTALVALTQYALRPGYAKAIKLNLALELVDRHGKPMPPTLQLRAAQAKGSIKRANKRTVESAIRAEFIIGSNLGRRTFNVYTGGR